MDPIQKEMLEKLKEAKGRHIFLSRHFDFGNEKVMSAHRQLLESGYIDMDGTGDWITDKGKKALENA